MTPYKLLTALSVRKASWVKGKTLQEAWAKCEHGPAMLLICTAMSGAAYEGWPPCTDLVGIYLQIFKLVGIPRAGQFTRMSTDLFELLWNQHLLGVDDVTEGKEWDRIYKSRSILKDRGSRKLSSTQILCAALELRYLLGESTLAGIRNDFWYQSELFLTHILAACKNDRAATCKLIADLCRSNLSVPDLAVFANSNEGLTESFGEPYVIGGDKTILLGYLPILER